MRNYRFYHHGTYQINDIVELNPNAFQHAIKVLRLQLNDQMIIFNGLGKAFLAEIISVSKKQCTVKIIAEQSLPNESPLKIHLYCSIIKTDKMDWLLQKAVELGVNRITPIITTFTDIKLTTEKIQKKLEHWQAVIINACEQCERDYLPIIDEPVMFAKLFKQDLMQPVFFCDPEAENKFRDIKLTNQHLSIIIGPEGGFSQAEVTEMLQQNYIPIKLGGRILRAETAALAAISICQNLWGDL